MHGAYIGRTLLRERSGVLPKIYYTAEIPALFHPDHSGRPAELCWGVLPKIYYTAETHYSIQIIRDLLGLEEVLVETNADASMNMEDLEVKLAQHRNAPVLLIATIGTTFKGGIDDIDAIRARLKGREAYLHLDAALFGGYLQVSDFAAEMLRNGEDGKRYDSLAVSCHKFFGFPSPAGLFICGRHDFEEYRTYFEKVHDPDYISHVPGTITCSRDAVKAAEFHYYCTDESLRQQQRDAKKILEDARYLQQQMQRHFPQLNPVRVNQRSNIVFFNNTISDALRRKWVLATVEASEQRGPSLAHVLVMPHVDRKILDRFLNDLEQDQKGFG